MMSSSIVGYKTLIVSALVTLVGFLQGMNWVDILPDNPQLVGWIVTGLGVIMAVLRYFTTGPIGTK